MNTQKICNCTACNQTKQNNWIVVLLVCVVFTIYMYICIQSSSLFKNLSLPVSLKMELIQRENDQSNVQVNPVPHFICPQFGGRAGNLLFQYASSYGIAKNNGMKLILNKKCELLKYFNLVADIRQDTSMCDSQNVILIKEKQSASFDYTVMNLNKKHNVKLTSNLQSYLYFERYTTDLKHSFRFKNHIREKARTILVKLLLKFNITRTNWAEDENRMYYENRNGSLRKEIILIGVHIRRGDWTELSERGYKVASRQYLNKAVEWYIKRYDNLLFVVVSNGLTWASNNMPVSTKIIYLEGNSEWLDLATVTMCNHFIATVGTFSWWAAWLTGGNVTYFKWPAREGTPFRRIFSEDYQDHYFPHWIGLS